VESSSIPNRPSTADAVSASRGGGYQRRSSGLVRDFSQLDTWMYNVLAMNPVIVGALTFGLVLVIYPGANLWLAFVIAGAFCCFEAVAYALFAAAMPRSGGDYVMQSRVLGGGVASVATFAGISLSQCFLPGIFGFLLSSIILSPFFLLLGAQYDAAWMTSVGEWLGTNWGTFACAMFVAVQGTLVNIRGLRLYARIQKIVFWPGLALLVFFTLQMLFSSHADFVGNFNEFMSSNYGVKDAYQATIEAGGTIGGTSVGDTILASVVGAFLLIFPAYSVQQAGEIKRAGSVRGNLYSMLGSEVFTFVTMAVLGALLLSVVGKDFLFGSTNLYFEGSESNPLPVPPFLGFFFAIVGNAPIFTWLLLIMFLCWMLMLYPNGWLGGSRIMVAMSFDGILPEWFGRINRRFHAPINALFAMTAVGIPLAYLYIFQPSIQELTLSYFIILLTTFGVTMVAAILFPWTRRELYEASAAAKYKVGGLPLISVAAAVFLAFVVFCDYQALTADELGVNSTKGLLFLCGLWGVAFVVYWTAKLYRRSRGESLSDAYRELPIE
jgi:basic amino acid/polyamine antiporter, APA family